VKVKKFKYMLFYLTIYNILIIKYIIILNKHIMDNQQPNPEEGRVQRLSRKRVLSNNITWETPQIKNKIYK